MSAPHPAQHDTPASPTDLDDAAQKIVAAQATEISDMEAWLTRHGK